MVGIDAVEVSGNRGVSPRLFSCQLSVVSGIQLVEDGGHINR